MFVYTRTEHCRITTQISTNRFIYSYLFPGSKDNIKLIQPLLFIILFPCSTSTLHHSVFTFIGPSFSYAFPSRLICTTPTATVMFDKVKDFFQSDFFDARWKGKVFAAQVGVTTLAFILGIAKLATRPSYVPMSRMDIMAITMVCHCNLSRRH